MNSIINSPFAQVLKIKSFLFLWLGQVFSQIAVNMMNFVLLLHIAKVTHSNTADSMFILAISLPAVIFGSLAGVYVDTWQKKKVLIICNFLRVLVVIFFIFSPKTLLVIFTLAIAASIITQFFVPAEAPLIPEIVPGNLLFAANGFFTLTFFISVMLGFMLAGPALLLLDLRLVFLLIAMLFLLATLLINFIPNTKKETSNIKNPVRFAKREIITEFVIGYRYLKNQKNIQDAIILMASSQVLIATMVAIAPGFAATVLNIGIEESSIYVVAPAVLGMILGSLAIGQVSFKIDKQKLINWSILAGGIFTSVLSFLSRGKYRTHINFNYIFPIDILHLAILMLFLLGLANALVTISANTILQEETQENVRSRIYGFLTAAGGLASIVPIILSGILSDRFGVVKVMFAIGCCIILFWILRMIRWQRLFILKK